MVSTARFYDFYSQCASVLVLNSCYLTYHRFHLEIGFNFHKSPDIGVNETAVYMCSVTHSGFGVFWYINDTPSLSLKIKILGIATEGSSTLQSNISIPGDAALNGTVVLCLASGYLDGNYITLSKEDILLIQG